jgi:Mg/Co/Ni transporter MgtE
LENIVDRHESAVAFDHDVEGLQEIVDKMSLETGRVVKEADSKLTGMLAIADHLHILKDVTHDDHVRAEGAMLVSL